MDDNRIIEEIYEEHFRALHAGFHPNVLRLPLVDAARLRALTDTVQRRARLLEKYTPEQLDPVGKVVMGMLIVADPTVPRITALLEVTPGLSTSFEDGLTGRLGRRLTSSSHREWG